MIALGILDISAAAMLGLRIFNINIVHWLLIALAIYLLIKVILFPFNIASAVDLFAAVLLIFSIFGLLPQEFPLLIAGVLGMKGIQSIFFPGLL